MAAERLQRQAAAVPGLGMLRIEREQPVVAGERPRIASGAEQRIGPIEQRLGVVRVERKRQIVFGDRRIALPEREERIGAVDARGQMARLARQHLVGHRERIVRPAEIDENVAAVCQRFEMIGVDCKRLVETRKPSAGCFSAQRTRPRLASASGEFGLTFSAAVIRRCASPALPDCSFARPSRCSASN